MPPHALLPSQCPPLSSQQILHGTGCSSQGAATLLRERAKGLRPHGELRGGPRGRRVWLAPTPRNQHSSMGLEILQQLCLSSPSQAGLVSGVPFLNRIVTAWFLLAPVSTSPSIQVSSWVPSPFLSLFARTLNLYEGNHKNVYEAVHK